MAWYGSLDGLEIDMQPYDPAHDVPSVRPPFVPPQYELPSDKSYGVPPREQTIAKAVVAFSGSLGVALLAAVADGRVTVWEVVLGVLAAVGTAGGVWATSNKP